MLGFHKATLGKVCDFKSKFEFTWPGCVIPVNLNLNVHNKHNIHC